ncbi:MAG: nucleotide exchange factor GrpE [Candidatus Levybacteria bacterium]|nr:nucleotide exchange factor GrpE [Candidatus Levybacteria bacterium]
MTKDDAKIKKESEKTKEATEAELLKYKIEELENQNKRLLADYRNLEKRVESQRKDLILKANKQLILQILPILDTLIFADKQSKGQDQTLNLIIKQFLDILKLEGVEKIKTQGADFDPNLMECIETVEGDEGKVIEETRSGYALYGETLRPADVRIGKKGN